MSDSSSTISWSTDIGLMVPVLLTIAGLVIWLFGARVLRSVMATVGLILGGALGWAIGLEMHDIAPVPAWAMMLITGLTVACAAAIGHRLLVTLALMAVFGLAGPLAVWAVGDLVVASPDLTWPRQDEAAADFESDPPDDVAAWIRDRPVATEDGSSSVGGDSESTTEAGGVRSLLQRWGSTFGLTDEVLQRRTTEARTYSERVRSWAGEAWSDTPERTRTNVIGTAVIGLLMGLLVGTILPRFSASLVTSVGGGLLWLTSGLTVVGRLGFADASWMPTSPLAWSLAWGFIAVIGLWIQWIKRPGKADRSR